MDLRLRDRLQRVREEAVFRSRWRMSLVAVLTPLFTAGCAAISAASCSDTDLSLPPVHVIDLKATLLLTATLTTGDRPVAAAKVSFFIRTVDPARPGPEGGFRTGSGITDNDGVVRYSRKGGLIDVQLMKERVTAYEAEFIPLTKIGGVNYCGAKGRGELSAQ
jgi:hypothetical protein